MSERIINISAKCSDLFSAQLFEDGKFKGSYDGYVPSWLPHPGEKHCGDYVQLSINVDTGQITNWKKPPQTELKKLFTKSIDD